MTMRARGVGSVVLFSLLLTSPVAAEAPADLDSVVARAMQVFEVPGIGLAIVQSLRPVRQDR